VKREFPTFRVACAVSIGFEEVSKYLTSLKGVEIVDISTALKGDWDNKPCHGLVIYASQFSTPVANWIQKQPLKWIHLVTAGTDPLDLLPIPEDVHVSSSGHLWSCTVAEHALGMLLTLCRGIDFSIRTVQTDQWSRDQVIPRLRRVKDLAVLIVGYGRIGSEIGRILKSLGAKVTGVASSSRTVDGVTVHQLPDLDALIPEADVIILTLPLGPLTRHLISRTQFALMKKTLILINVSRGGVLDEAVLCETLANGGISCAGLDVFENEPLPLNDRLRSSPNVLLTPHIAGFGERDIEKAIAVNVRDNLQDILAGRMPRNQVHQKPY
jgi:phosphoglycerate dehydrogenase-like enzyme